MDKIKEANERISILKSMGLWNEVVEYWNKEQKPCFSERGSAFGMDVGTNYKFSENPEFETIKENFEKENNCLVYYGIYSNSNIGKILSLLYVSNYEEEWELDRSDLKEGFPLAYVYNMTYEPDSEFGSIGIKAANGGFIRIY